MSRSIKQFSKTTMQHYGYHGGTDEAQTGAVGNLSALLVVGAGAACLAPVPLRVLPPKVTSGPRVPKFGGSCPRKRAKKRPAATNKKGASNNCLRQCAGRINQCRNMDSAPALIAREDSGGLAITGISARAPSGGFKQDFIQISPRAINGGDRKSNSRS